MANSFGFGILLKQLHGSVSKTLRGLKSTDVYNFEK